VGKDKKLTKEISEKEQQIVDLVIRSSKGPNNLILGARSIKNILQNKHNVKVSRRVIRRIMFAKGIHSNYVFKHYKPNRECVVNVDCPNLLKRGFSGRKAREWLVSDLTYVLVNGKWYYICSIIDLFNREVVGYSVGEHKTSTLVLEALMSIKFNLSTVKYFHSDCGSEFRARDVVKFIESFGIQRSLSNPGTPIDNAVAESHFKSVKTELVLFNKFASLEDLRCKVEVYMTWFNNERPHSFCGGVAPLQYATMQHHQGENNALSL
jgi:putative transposase